MAIINQQSVAASDPNKKNRGTRAKLSRMCVPLFFILSGYLLLDKKESLYSFFKKRICKVVIPLIVWSLFYVLWKQYYEGNGSISFYSFYSLALRPAYYHLWFLYAIVGLYLFVPILRILVQNSNKELLYYFVALWFVAVSVIPVLENITDIDSKIDLEMISGYVGYLVIGYLIGDIKITQKYFIISTFIVILTIVFTSLGTYILTIRNNGQFVGFLYSYLSPNIIFLSVFFFVFIKYISVKIGTFKIDFLKKMIKVISSASLGIYFIHPMILDVLKKGDLGFELSAFYSSAIYSVPLTAVVTFILSFCIILSIQRIPIIRHIVP